MGTQGAKYIYFKTGREERLMSGIKVLLASDIHAIVAHFGADEIMDRLITDLDSGLRAFDPNEIVQPARNGLNCTGLIEWMPLRRGMQDVVIKIVSYFPNNPGNFNLPTIQAYIVRCDGATGIVTDIADGALLTAMRTGAASAVASKILACPMSRVLGLVGCGAQAITQAHALTRVFPIRQILAYDASIETAKTLVGRLAFLGIEIEVAPLSAVEQRADILCTATSVDRGGGPVIEGSALKSTLHINAVGADYRGKVEIPVPVLLRAALVVPDHLDQACNEGECQQIPTARVGPELHQLVKHADIYSRHRHSLTVFDSTGIPLEDAIALDLIKNLGAEINVGSILSAREILGDPKNPYSGLANPLSLISI
jgi:ornithine cyclodeaminase/alanine dehydrogenase-like protein (mu-crystallin family)